MRKFFLILSLAVLLAGTAVIAQEADQASETGSADKAREGAEPKEPAAPAPPPADDEFIPSERISADQEVIFPVDI